MVLIMTESSEKKSKVSKDLSNKHPIYETRQAPSKKRPDGSSDGK